LYTGWGKVQPISKLQGVEAKYRFTGEWYFRGNDEYDGTITLGTNFITTTDADISYLNVYTTGGGMVTFATLSSWAYLYSGDQKIGVALACTVIPNNRQLALGKTEVIDWNFPDIVTSDMQDDYNGWAEDWD